MDMFDVMLGSKLGGGGGDTGDYNDLTNKPKINSVTLSGNKSSSDLGLASTSDLEGKANAADVYTKSEVYNKTEVYTKAETTAEIGGAINDLDVSSTSTSGHYIKSIAQENGLIVPVADTVQDYLSPSSTHPVTSGAVYSANQTLDEKITKNTSALVDVVNNGAKNLLPINRLSVLQSQNTGGTWTGNVYSYRGVTYTVNDDFTISATGTATGGNANLILSPVGGFTIESGQWVLSGCPAGGSASTYNLSVSGTASDVGSTATFTSCSSAIVRIYIIERTTVNNLLFKPMICSKAQWDISQTYEPYTLSNPELTFMTAAIPELVDSGAKNRAEIMLGTATYNNLTFTVDKEAGTITVSTDGNPASQYKGFRFLGDPDSTGWAYGVPIPRGTYVVRGINPTMTQTGMRYIIGITASSGSTRTTTQIWTDSEFTVSNDTTRIDMALYVPTGWTSDTPQMCKPMICMKKLWDVAPTLTPYAPTNAELYQMILALQSGTRSVQMRTEPDETSGEEETR